MNKEWIPQGKIEHLSEDEQKQLDKDSSLYSEPDEDDEETMNFFRGEKHAK